MKKTLKLVKKTIVRLDQALSARVKGGIGMDQRLVAFTDG